MTLIKLQTDVVVAEEIRHLVISENIVTVHFRNLPETESFEYEYETEEEAQVEMKQAVIQMMRCTLNLPLPPRQNEN